MTHSSTPPRSYDPALARLPVGGSRAAARRVEREDLVTFINAAFSSTGQREFYGDAAGQAISIDFLHEYIHGNYRRLYARCLAVGLNHFNTAKIIVNLLASSGESQAADWREDGPLVTAALQRLPAPQAFRLFKALAQRKVNNRRTRALVRQWLQARPDPDFDAVKYRGSVRAIVRHCHLRLPPERGRFLFHGTRGRPYEHSLFESYRRARHDVRAIYELPYTVAEGFAARHRIDRATFLAGIEPRMTQRERLRLQQSSRREGVEVRADLDAMTLTRLCSFVVTRPLAERRERAVELHGALQRAARRIVQQQRWRLGSVAAVLDRSWSSSGSEEKHRRPLALALAVHYLLREAAERYEAHWTPPPPAEAGLGDPPLASLDAATMAAVPDPALLLEPYGATDLATPIVAALRGQPSLVVVLSDGYDNDPPGGAGEVLRVYRERLDPPARTVVVHVNPVFDANDFSPRALTPTVPTIGVRDASDLPTMLAFARFAAADAALDGLHEFLEARVAELVGHAPSQGGP
jgi:hypothetical protein